MKARNRPHGTHTHGGTSGINGHGDIGGEAQGSLGRQKWELGIGGRKQNGDGMGWEGRGGEEPKGPAALFFQPKLSPSPSPTAAAAAASSYHFTSLPTYRLLLGPGLGLLHRAGGLRGLRLHLLHFVGRWDAMGWDGMGWDGMGWDGMGEKSIECRGGERGEAKARRGRGPEIPTGVRAGGRRSAPARGGGCGSGRARAGPASPNIQSPPKTLLATARVSTS